MRRVLSAGLGVWFGLVAACASGPDLRIDDPAPVAGPTSAEPAGLAARLPADTRVYMRLDLERLLDWIGAYLRFIDPQIAKQVSVEARRAWDQAVELSSVRGFSPKLAGHLFSTRLHLVGLDQQAGPGGPRGSDDESSLCLSLVVECGRESAIDFVGQLKADLERREGASPDRQAPAWTQLEVAAGELIRLSDAELTVGWVDEFLIVSYEVPHRLWSAILSPGGQALTETERFGRFGHGDPAWFAVVDLSGLGRGLERNQEENYLEDLRRADELPPAEAEVLRQVATTVRDGVGLVLRLLSVDRLEAFGARFLMQTGVDSLRFELVTGLQHAEPISRVLTELFEGGRPFRLPAAELGTGLSVLARLGLAEIYAEVVSQLGPELHQQVQLASAMVQGATGYSILDLVRLFSGDVYLFADLDGQAPGDAQPDPGYRNLTLLGVVDSQASQRALAKIYAALAGLELFAPMLSRLDFQGRQVILVGPSSTAGQSDPSRSLAFALLDRHLAVGSFAEVTGVIRREQAGPASAQDLLARVLGQHRQAGLLVVLTQGLTERFERFVADQEEKASIDQLLDKLLGSSEAGGPEPAAEALRAAVTSLIERFEELSKKRAGFGEPGLVVHGQHRERLYDLVLETELRRH